MTAKGRKPPPNRHLKGHSQNVGLPDKFPHRTIQPSANAKSDPWHSTPNHGSRCLLNNRSKHLDVIVLLVVLAHF